MGGFFSRPDTPAPQILPGFEFLPQLLQALGQQTQGQFGNIFNIPQLGAQGKAQGATGAGLDQLLSSIGIGGPAAETFQQGLTTGFTPQVLQSVEAGLLPALERSFGRGTEAINASAAERGTLNSTGTVREIGELRGGLESQLQSTLANIAGQGALQGQGIQAGLAGQGVGLPAQSLGALAPILQLMFQQGNVAAGQPLAALGAINQGAASSPFFQPTTGPSKFESLLGAAAPAGAAFLGGPGGASIANKFAGGGGAPGQASGAGAPFNPFAAFGLPFNPFGMFAGRVQ